MKSCFSAVSAVVAVLSAILTTIAVSHASKNLMWGLAVISFLSSIFYMMETYFGQRR